MVINKKTLWIMETSLFAVTILSVFLILFVHYPKVQTAQPGMEQGMVGLYIVLLLVSDLFSVGVIAFLLPYFFKVEWKKKTGKTILFSILIYLSIQVQLSFVWSNIL